MSFWKSLLGIADEAPSHPPIDQPPSARTIARADLNVARFQRALDQCDASRPERRAELQAHLNYHTALRDAAALKPE